MINSHKRQRAAWIVMLGSLFICVLMGVTIPLAANAFVQNSTRPLDATIQANQGTVGIDDEAGQRRAVLAGESALGVEPLATILTDTTASALLTVTPPDEDQPVGRIQISSNTSLILEGADAPRYSTSRLPYLLQISLPSGRVRLDVPLDNERQVEVEVSTPQGRLEIAEAGRYTIEVNNDATQVTVLERGMASINAMDETLSLFPGQRAEIPTESGPVGPLDPARDLIQNGGFGAELDNWAEFAWRVERDDQPAGEVSVETSGGDPTLTIARNGVGHADVKLSQSINADVADYEALRLLLTLRIVEQSLGVCGEQGSECPLFVVLNYIDDQGVSRIWQHGFYGFGEVDDKLTPGECMSCAVVQQSHERVTLGQVYFYEVDLKEEFARQGFLPPRFIESVSLVSSGHTFTTEVGDVALIVE